MNIPLFGQLHYAQKQSTLRTDYVRVYCISPKADASFGAVKFLRLSKPSLHLGRTDGNGPKIEGWE